MPTNRRKRARVSALDHWKIDQLVTGQCLIAGVGYAELAFHGRNHWSTDDEAAVREAMRADWAIHGPTVMAWWRGENERFTDNFTSREKLREYLKRHGETGPWAAREFGVRECTSTRAGQRSAS